MKIAALSTEPSLYSTIKLVEAGEKRSHEVHVIDYLRCLRILHLGSLKLFIKVSL